MSDAIAVRGQCRVVVDAPGSGVWNMAVDEALLDWCAETGETVVRLYTWGEPTVSLGYFQRDGLPASLEGLPVVRRLSGGGALLHDREWTYSVSVPVAHPLARDPRQIYRVVHERIVEWLAGWGMTLALRGQAHPDREGNFLCFERGDPHDLVIGRHKVLGSAQRRRRGSILQHGSLLLEHSPVAPQLLGLCDLLLVDRTRFLTEQSRAEMARVIATAIGSPSDTARSAAPFLLSPLPDAVVQRCRSASVS